MQIFLGLFFESSTMFIANCNPLGRLDCFESTSLFMWREQVLQDTKNSNHFWPNVAWEGRRTSNHTTAIVGRCQGCPRYGQSTKFWVIIKQRIWWYCSLEWRHLSFFVIKIIKLLYSSKRLSNDTGIPCGKAHIFINEKREVRARLTNGNRSSRGT